MPRPCSRTGPPLRTRVQHVGKSTPRPGIEPETFRYTAIRRHAHAESPDCNSLPQILEAGLELAISSVGWRRLVHLATPASDPTFAEQYDVFPSRTTAQRNRSFHPPFPSQEKAPHMGLSLAVAPGLGSRDKTSRCGTWCFGCSRCGARPAGPG